MAGYGMNYTGRGFGRFLEGVKAGLGGGQEFAMREQQMRNTEEDREYLRGQRERETRLQGQQDEDAIYSREINNALREFVGSGGAKYQQAAELLNKFNANPDTKIGISRNEDGTFIVGAVDLEGNPVGKPNKFTFDDFGKRLYAMSKPDVYFKGMDQKGRYNESERGVLDTATGVFKEHGPGTRKRMGKVDPATKHQRLLINDATNLLLKKFGGYIDGEGNLAFADDANAEMGMNAIEMAADLIKEGESPQRAANIAANKAAQGALPKSRRTAASSPNAAPGAPGSTAAKIPPLEQRKPGQVFDTPKGRMTWTGTGWVPAQ